MDIRHAALAGLLHDIGKFWQRAESSKQRRLGQGYEDLNPDHYGRNGAHATWSAAFVDQYVPEPFREAIRSAVLFHHNPTDEATRLTALADRLSSGERKSSIDVSPKQLQSVFCQLMQQDLSPHYWPLSQLALDEEVVFPSDHQMSENDSRHSYQDLWAGFVKEAEPLASEIDLDTYIEGLLGLMMRYTWCIPSAFYRSISDISLYDHSRTTAAIASVLAAVDKPAQVEKLLLEQDETSVATLIEGDISGVQKFIYTVTTRAAGKLLRARSLYLQFLSEAAARLIIRSFGMPATNILYVGGGHFYLLVPPDADARLLEIRRQIDDMLLTHHDGELYLALGTASVTAVDFANSEQFAKQWQQVGQSTGADKRRRFAHFSSHEQVERIFSPRAHVVDSEMGLRQIERDEVEEGEIIRSAFSDSLIGLGRDLGRASAIVFCETEIHSSSPGTFNDALAALGGVARLVDADGKLMGEAPQLHIARAVVLGIQEPPERKLVETVQRTLACPVASGLRYTVSELPRKYPDDVAEFSDLQATSQGIKRLGVLRMDVDDLGLFFAKGFIDVEGQSQASLSRVASLSFAFSYFFEGWVGKLCRQVNSDYQRPTETSDQVEAVYTVYSGGDDLFVVGAWDVLPDLAEKIRFDLGRFACENPAVHVSAGITLHSGKFPLYQAANAAEQALEEAKSVDGKDSISFLGRPIRWRDWREVTHVKNKLLSLHEANVPRGLFHMLLELYEEYDENRRRLYAQSTNTGQAQMVWGPWIWHSAYRIHQLASRHKDHKEVIESLQEDMQEDRFQGIERVGLAARWADAYTRRSSDK